MIYLALALALAPAPTLTGFQAMLLESYSNITWQRIDRYLASDNRSGPNVVLLTDCAPGVEGVFNRTPETRGSKNEQFSKDALRMGGTPKPIPTQDKDA